MFTEPKPATAAAFQTAPPFSPRSPLPLPEKTRLGPNIVAGALCALVTLAYASSFATLIFGGPLAPSVNLGLWAAVIGSCAAALALSFLSSFRFALGGPDSNPSAILAISAAALSAEILNGTADSARSELLPTVLMFLFGSAVLCGLLLFLFGRFRWGRYVRYIPHPVVGGFLAGTGYLLLAGGWKMLTGKNFAATTAADLQVVPPLGWVFALGLGLALVAATRLSKHFLVVPVVLAAGVLGFHATLLATGWSLEEARSAGLLAPPLTGSDWQTPFNQPFGEVRWDLLLAHGKDFVAMTLVVLVSILLNATSLDLATGKEADFERELKALGVANVLGGLAGGLVSVNSFNRSLLNHRAGANSPWAARVFAGIVLGTAVFAPGAISLLPRPVLVGLVLYLGVSLLLNWLWDSRRELPVADYLTVVAILVIVAAFGIVQGVIMGVVIASLSFVVTFSLQSVVKQRFTAATRRSNVERTPAELTWLAENGGRLNGFVLQGHIFFGTANSLLEEIRTVLGKGEALLIDFWLVRGLDASSVVVLRKLLRLAGEQNTQLVFTGLDDTLRTRFAACGLPLEKTPARLFSDLDRGLEWAESQLLTSARPDLTLNEVLGLTTSADSEALAARFTVLDLAAGNALFKRGEPSDSLYVLLRGQVSIHLQLPGSDYTKRLRSSGPGTIVGEMGFYGNAPRSADVVADIATRAARLDLKHLKALETARPDLAAQLHRFVINTLAARLRSANDELRQML